MEEDPQCWRSAPRDKQTSTDTIASDTAIPSVTQSVIESDDIGIENEENEIESVEKTSEQSARFAADTVCPSDIPLDDDWFCDTAGTQVILKNLNFLKSFFKNQTSSHTILVVKCDVMLVKNLIGTNVSAETDTATGERYFLKSQFALITPPL